MFAKFTGMGTECGTQRYELNNAANKEFPYLLLYDITRSMLRH